MKKIFFIVSLSIILITPIFAQNIEWDWFGGDSLINNYGEYSGVNLYPKARSGMCTTTDKFGHIWLFGGSSLDSTMQFTAYLSDLWKWNGVKWDLISGNNQLNQLWMIDGKNSPSARTDAACFSSDSSGDFYVFGGCRRQQKNSILYGNDLWKYSISDKNWTLVSGDTSNIKQLSTINKKSSADIENTPGSRLKMMFWQSKDSFFIFGGEGYDTSKFGNLNDIWIWTNNTWSFVRGNANSASHYGQKYQFDSLNLPPGRFDASSIFSDKYGLFLYGGSGLTAQEYLTNRDDFWNFNGKNWRWMDGSKVFDVSTNYCLKSKEDYNPGARADAIIWMNKDKVLYLFGGYAKQFKSNLRNDFWLWKENKWCLLNKKEIITNENGNYSAHYAWPGSRTGSASWTDSLGNLWLFGGYGYDADSNVGYLNDLWKYSPDKSVGHIEREKPLKMRVFPNPTSGQTFVVFASENGANSSANLTIYNSNGALIIADKIGGNQAALDLSHLPKGIYYLKLQTETGLTSQKLIKE